MALEPENVEYHLLLGGILRKIGMHDEAALIYANALRLEPQNLEVFIEAAANLQADERHEEALDLLRGAPDVARVDPLVVCRSFQSLYCLGRIQAAFSLLDAALDSTPDLCQLLATTFPAIEQDPNFATRALNAPKNP